MKVSDALTLQNLKSFELIAGEGGLDNQITKVGLLDYELVFGLDELFHKGDFVLTTFTAIRDDKDLIESYIRELIDSGVSALAIKNVFVKELSDSIIDYADKMNFPIFIFDRKVFYEDIIEDLLDGLKDRGLIDIVQSKLDTLLTNELESDVIVQITKDINPNFKKYQYVYYLRERAYINEKSAIEIAQRYKRSRHQRIENSVFKYKDALILVLTYDEPNKQMINDRDYIFDLMNIDIDKYYVGISKGSILDFDQILKESKYSCLVCEVEKADEKDYKDIGVYQLLMPYKDSWMKKYVDRILKPIKENDNGKLLETAKVYIENFGDIVKTADLLFQHKNTIRYRIQKMKTLLDIEEESVFYEQLSLAIKCNKLLNLKRL